MLGFSSGIHRFYIFFWNAIPCKLYYCGEMTLKSLELMLWYCERDNIFSSYKVGGSIAQWMVMWHLTTSRVGQQFSDSYLIVSHYHGNSRLVILPVFLSRPGGVRPPVCEPDRRKPHWYQSVWRAPVQSAVRPNWSGHRQIQQGGRLATEVYQSCF